MASRSTARASEQPVDRTHRNGIPVTSLARTVIDVSLEVPRLAPVIVNHVPPVMVGFEAQSYEHHSTLEAFAADVERNLELFGEGWMIVPITAVQVRDPPRLVGLMARIVEGAVGRWCSRARR
jgi:hypothetical protein